MRRILEMARESDLVFDVLAEYDQRVQEGLRECLYAAYGRIPKEDPVRIFEHDGGGADILIWDDD